VAEPIGETGAEPEPTPSDLLEQVGRDAGTLVLRELQLTAARHDEQIRRAIRNLTVAAVSTVALITFFALLNWGIVLALQGPLPGWRAPLVVGGAWLLLGIAGAAFLATRPEGIAGRPAPHPPPRAPTTRAWRTRVTAPSSRCAHRSAPSPAQLRARRA
jgi:hypothetical protein